MKRQFLAFVVFTLFILILPVNVSGFEHIDNINDGISVYFLAHLNNNQTIEINVTRTRDGNFALFLFDKRPTESFIELDKSLNTRIFDVAINYSLDDNPYINYTAPKSKIYYIQLILIENGPDSFYLQCNLDSLTRYYLPIISGYNISFLIISLILAFVIILYRGKLHNKLK
ncbi:hypothetical protein ES708_04524 [subsurface metagenome]